MSSIVGMRRRGPGIVGAAPGSGCRRRAHAMSPHRIVNAPELGDPSGFSHAVVATGATVYLAGQIGDGATIAEQFDSAAENLVVALRAAGG